MKSLQDTTVLALEQATVVPYLTYRLAMDGMEIIRLEHPVYGDPNRMIGDDVLNEARMNTYFLCNNAGKKALTLNLAEPEGRDLLARLIRELQVDIFVTNQLPRNYQKLGIDYETLQKIKADIIWLGVTGFGPESNEAAYDPILQARSGLMDLTGESDGDPQVIGIPLPDMGTSEHAYGLLMKALYQRALSGKGTRIDLAMFESSVSWLTVPITMTASFDKRITRRGNTHEFFSPVSVYRTSDGFIYLAVGNDRQWQSLTGLDPFKSLDTPVYRQNKGRIENVVELNRKINAITGKYTSAALIDMLTSITVPVSEIKPVAQVVNDPLTAKRLLFAQDPLTGTRIVLAPPPHMTPYLEAHERQMSFPPRFGEHNEAIYARIGCNADDLDRLKQKGII